MTDKKLHVIDGTGGKRAPSPTRKGLMRAIYETVDALGGASRHQIEKYLPAAIDDIKGLVRRKQLDRAIYSCVYDGYLIHNPDNDRYYVAPIDYYKARREWLQECSARSRVGVKKRKGSKHVDDHPPPWNSFAHRILVVSLCALCFAAGVVVGIIIV